MYQRFLLADTYFILFDLEKRISDRPASIIDRHRKYLLSIGPAVFGV